MDEKVVDWFKNWKSNVAFGVFVGLYVFTVYTGKEIGVVDITADIALIVTLFIMFRSKITTELLGKLIDNIKIGK